MSKLYGILDCPELHPMKRTMRGTTKLWSQVQTKEVGIEVMLTLEKDGRTHYEITFYPVLNLAINKDLLCIKAGEGYLEDIHFKEDSNEPN